MISNKYKILEKIGNGNFGSVFKGENIRTNEKVAIKLSSVKSEYNLLKNEAKIYQIIGNTPGFPQLKWYGIENDRHYLVINLLGESLSQIKQKHGALSEMFVSNIGVQMLERLKAFHDVGLIHRDIKPDNFVFGIDTNILYLIDYGFSKGFGKGFGKGCNKEFNKGFSKIHIDSTEEIPRRTNSIIGSINYISLNVHKKYEPSKKDDIESMCYVLLFLLDLLSWNKYECNSVQSLLNIITEKENIIHSTHLPSFLYNTLTYIRNLSFTEEPNYEQIKRYFVRL